MASSTPLSWKCVRKIVSVVFHRSDLIGDSTCLNHHTCALACRQVGNKLFENGKRNYQISLKLTYLARQDALSNREHRLTPIHGGTLNTSVGIRLRETLPLHKDSLGPFDNLAIFQSLAERSILRREVAKLLKASPGNLQCRFQLMFLNGLHQISKHVLFHGPAD